jgi:hypothetical protein
MPVVEKVWVSEDMYKHPKIVFKFTLNKNSFRIQLTGRPRGPISPRRPGNPGGPIGPV